MDPNRGEAQSDSNATGDSLATIQIQLRAIRECIGAIESHDIASSGLPISTHSCLVNLQMLARIKSQLMFQIGISVATQPFYESKTKFNDLDSNCIDAIFNLLTMRQTVGVERVSKSWQESVKKALRNQTHLKIVSTTNKMTFERHREVEFIYNSAAASKLFAMLPAVTNLTFVGFELDFQRFTLVKKFPKLTKICFANSKIFDSVNGWKGLVNLEVVKSLESLEFTLTGIDDSFFPELLPIAKSLKQICIHSLPFRFGNWSGLFGHLGGQLEWLAVTALDFHDYLRSALTPKKKHKAITPQLSQKLANLQVLQILMTDFEMVTTLMRNLPKVKILRILNLTGETIITGRDLVPFKGLEELTLASADMPTFGPILNFKFDSMSFEILSDMPVFANLKKLALLGFKITTCNMAQLCDKVPNVEWMEWIYQIECRCKKMKKGKKKVCSNKHDSNLDSFEHLKSLLIKGDPDCKHLMLNFLKEQCLPRLQFLKVESKTINKEFLDAIFEFAKRKPKREFVLDTTRKIGIPVNYKPRNVTLLP